MVRRVEKSFVVIFIALLMAFTFTAGEVLISPDFHSADAARKRRGRTQKEKKDATQDEQKGDELQQILEGQQDDGKIDVNTLRVEDDFALTSTVGIKIDESIEKLMRILENFQEPGTLRRLAEFYWKKSHQLNLDLMKAHQGRMDGWFEAGQKGDPPKEPDSEIWFKYNRKAVEICQLIIDRYPDFQGMDEVYFFMGYNLNEVGRDADAVIYYKKLVRQFPNSGYVPDSWMAIGDYYFSHNNVYDALPAYEEVLRHEASKVFGFAKYKIAWCYFNLGKYDDAIETFKEVVAWSQDQSKRGKSQITLMEESLKDLVMGFAEKGSVDEAEKYFLSVGGKKYFRMMLVRLADIYTNQGKFVDSIAIYRRLIKDYPLHKDDPDFQMKIVEAYSNLNDKENTTKEIVNMVYYAKPAEESEWVKENQKTEEERVQEAWENAERMLIKTVVEYHKEAIKIKNEKTWDMAQQLYELYLQYFKQSKTYYDVSFNYAELLYSRNNFVKAGEWYTIVAEMDSKGKHFEDASYNAILSYEKLVHKEIQAWIGDTKKRSKRKDKNYKLQSKKEMDAKEAEQAEAYAEREFSDNTKGFVKACNIYIDNIPQSSKKVDIIYKVAIIHYAHNHFDNAVKRFELIVTDYPRHRLAVYSANLILDSLNISKNWRKLNETVRAYLKNKRLVPAKGRAAFRRDLVDLNEKSSFKKVEVTEQEKRWVAAAEEYLTFCKEFPKSKMRDTAMYNAAVHYVTAGEIEQSIAVQRRFLKEYPKSAYAGDVLFKLGKNLEALAYFDEAANRYEEYDKKYPKGEHRSTALFNAAIFHESLGHTEKGVALKKKYMGISKDEGEKDQLLFGVGYTYLDVKDDAKAEKAFKDYLKKREKDVTWPRYDKKSGERLAKGKIKGDANRIYAAHIELMRIAERQSNQKVIESERALILKLADCDTDVSLGEPAREAIAEASFHRLESQYTSYVAYKLEVGRRVKQETWNKKMMERLKDKSNKAVAMAEAYGKIVELQSPKWSVAALFRIGQVYKYYSLAMFNSEIPYWLTPDQEVIYVERIQMRAEPIERKALEGFEKCLLTAYRTGVYNDYTIKAREELQGYVPSVYIPINEIKMEPGFESEALYVAKFETPDVPDIPERRPTIPVAPVNQTSQAAGE